MVNDSVQQFLDELASKASTPGGGSAAAIMGAMGAALVSMVCNLTVGKKGYEDVDADMQALLEEAEALRGRVTGMVNDDIAVFDKVMGAYGMPKDDDEQKAARSAAIQAALKEATDVPLACARAGSEAIALSGRAAEAGNKNVISDAGVAVMAAYAALKSAALNVFINIGSIKDADFAASREKEIRELLAAAERDTQAIYDVVLKRL